MRKATMYAKAPLIKYAVLAIIVVAETEINSQVLHSHKVKYDISLC